MNFPGRTSNGLLKNQAIEACCRMLDGFEDRSAVIRCTFGYFDGEVMEFFDSELPGTIAEHPARENGFGFDLFFINEGYITTRAEMTQEENELTYAAKMKPFAKVREYLINLE